MCYFQNICQHVIYTWHTGQNQTCHISRGKRPSFTAQKATFYKLKDGILQANRQHLVFQQLTTRTVRTAKTYSFRSQRTKFSPRERHALTMETLIA